MSFSGIAANAMAFVTLPPSTHHSKEGYVSPRPSAVTDAVAETRCPTTEMAVMAPALLAWSVATPTPFVGTV